MGGNVFGPLMIALGLVSILFRRQLVRWFYELPRSGATLTEPQARNRETLQLIVGVILIIFGVAVVVLHL
jgi:hypothetical protein